MPRKTMTAHELAEVLGISAWAIYQSAKTGTFPIAPIRVGRRLVWSRAAVEELLGVPADSPRGHDDGE